MTFLDLFHAATGGKTPYLWQCRLACGEPPPEANCDLHNPDEATLNWLSQGTSCSSRLIDIPTGLGKTIGVVMAWLWNSLRSQTVTLDTPWPRRLVYCLPMRTLVEQTVSETESWIRELRAAALSGNIRLSEPALQNLLWLCGSADLSKSEISNLPFEIHHREAASPVILMGGEDLSETKRDWDLYPEKPCILIGTQDMLLSRALNRGYGMSRYRWPMHFALLNNDALWVMDEVQLMGAGLACTTQMEGFRTSPALGSQQCASWWMSATIRPQWLQTVDCPEKLLTAAPLRLLEREKHDAGRIQGLRSAPKHLQKASVSAGNSETAGMARFIVENSTRLGLNLVVVNTVRRARVLFNDLEKAIPKGSLPPILLHSQFRPKDRQRVLQSICNAEPGQIVISTQVIEAGVDLSAHTLFTELAPWSSLVQRFGRCNRWLTQEGNPNYSDAKVYWFNIDPDKEALPYESDHIREAASRLEKLTNVSIEQLESIESPDADQPRFRSVVRRKDLIELFDTTPDLAGGDIDVDRFIRDVSHSHVQVYWRNWAGGPDRDPGSDPMNQNAPTHNELCSVGFAGKENFSFKDFVEKQGHAWRWNYLDRVWQKVTKDKIYPGQTYLLHVAQGGYDPRQGWTGNPKTEVHAEAIPMELRHSPLEAYGADSLSEQDQWQTIAQHTSLVCSVLKSIIARSETILEHINSGCQESLQFILEISARWHDWGKAHLAFQAKVDPGQLARAIEQKWIPACALVAKAPSKEPNAWIQTPGISRPDESHRRHFRHELASALAVLHPASGFPLTECKSRDLAAYLIAAHHGKVRLSIRSLPNEVIPEQTRLHPTSRRFARGVWDGDTLPTCDLGDGNFAESVSLSLEPMELGLSEEWPFEGQPSWSERCLFLRDEMGPFALAYLETLLRCADARASKLQI
ncbi:MAG: CRISPR-associated endonuclease Cas3'' [Opitutales bacterium]|nr:CRISPR-associated endonuclease Cas3'' [Opitutales bacterium]